MSKPKISQHTYEQYEDAVVALFMEHYCVATGRKLLSERETEPEAFPEGLDTRCKTLLQKEATRQRWLRFRKYTGRVAKSAALFFVACLTLFSMLFVTVEGFRSQVINFYIEYTEDTWKISGDPIHADSPKFDTQDPLKGLLPAAYRLDRIENEDPQKLSAIYLTDNNTYIIFGISPAEALKIVDVENTDTARELTVRDCHAVFTVKRETATLVWLDPEAGVMYQLSADHMTESDLVGIAEKLMESTKD